MKQVSTERCYICGTDSTFVIEESATLFREAKCISCGASKRNSDVAKTIVLTYGGHDSLPKSLHMLVNNFRIYESQSSGPIHHILYNFPNYICSEYIDDTSPCLYKNGIRCENLMSLTFPDNHFHLVITQDVLEHVQNPYKAFEEIYRVLAPNGFHIFTVPFHEGHSTLSRIIMVNNQPILCKPIVYHGDPLRISGSIVYTDFGEDMVERLNSMGMPTEIVKYTDWYKENEISIIDSDIDYVEYYKYYETKNLEKFFKYNSIVFRSQKRHKEGGKL